MHARPISIPVSKPSFWSDWVTALESPIQLNTCKNGKTVKDSRNLDYWRHYKIRRDDLKQSVLRLLFSAQGFCFVSCGLKIVSVSFHFFERLDSTRQKCRRRIREYWTNNSIFSVNIDVQLTWTGIRSIRRKFWLNLPAGKTLRETIDKEKCATWYTRWLSISLRFSLICWHELQGFFILYKPLFLIMCRSGMYKKMFLVIASAMIVCKDIGT